ncbi:hypothetical protein A9R16_013665 [Acidiferrobacter thiooxydans]|uniref:hypothetical protein n=1 Tax=Acidiferrobacter thiooxydans TaxID=163359 RepID=UPI001C4000CB|nr:hypothetical protein [Acidiferrobacter thiooxydans]UEN99456.1 hypothetical protein A9R16_013665 [Acidiferrobacter thiooxydans]
MNESDWSRLQALLDAEDGPLLPALRRDFPGLAFVRCDASDMAASRPFRVTPTADVYLIDGRDHCVSLTSDLGAATGILIAMRERS